jgi:hypothetical protein
MKALIWRLFAAISALVAFIVGGCGTAEVHFNGEGSGYRSTTAKPADRDRGGVATKPTEHPQQKP